MILHYHQNSEMLLFKYDKRYWDYIYMEQRDIHVTLVCNKFPYN